MNFITFFIILLILSGCGFKPLYYGDYKNYVLSDFYCERITNDQKNPRATFFLNNDGQHFVDFSSKKKDSQMYSDDDLCSCKDFF